LRQREKRLWGDTPLAKVRLAPAQPADSDGLHRRLASIALNFGQLAGADRARGMGVRIHQGLHFGGQAQTGVGGDNGGATKILDATEEAVARTAGLALIGGFK
jgi:hypothetical protein